MLDQSNRSDDTVDIERAKQDRLLQRSNSIEKSRKLNVKDHQHKIENMLNDLKKDLSDSKKDMSNLRMELITVKSQNGTTNEDLTKYIIKEIARIGQDLQKKSQEIQQEQNFYDAQMVNLLKDKKKLDETTSILDQRIQKSESDVGFKHVYD